MKKSSLKWIGIFIGLLLLVTACGQDTPTPAPASSPTEPIKIAVLGPLTGPSGFLGQGGLQGATMAMEEINKKGGLLGRQVEIVSYDTEAKPDVAKLVAERAILVDKVVAITGVIMSEVSVALADVAAEHHVPLIISNAQTPKLNDIVLSDPEKYKYVFRTTTNSNFIGHYATDFIVEHLKPNYGVKKVAFVYEDLLYARGVVEAETPRMEAAGLETATFAFPMASTSFPELKRAQDWGANVVYTVVATGAIIPEVKQWADEKINAHFISGAAAVVNAPAGWEITQGTVEYATNSASSPSWGIPINERIVPWHDWWLERWGTMKNIDIAPSFYESLEVLFDATERAGTTDADAVVVALEATDLQVLRNRIVFRPDHNAKLGPGYAWEGTSGGVLGQWQEVDGKGDIVVVWPPEYGNPDDWVPTPWVK